MILQSQFAYGGAQLPVPGFNYYSPLTIQAGQVPSTQTDFPILISLTDARLKTVGNGGHVLDSEGDDIRPYSDISTAITGYEKVFYDGTNGILEMWVKRSSVSDGLITYLAYGNPSLTTDDSSATTWSASFSFVLHLSDGTTLNLSDSTAVNTFVNDNIATATTGKIDGACAFASASSQDLHSATTSTGNAFSLSAWVKATSFPNAYNTVIGFGPTTTMALFVKSTGKLACYLRATGEVSYDGTGSNTLSTATWYYLAMTYSSSAGLVGYVNGASDGTAAANGNATAHVDSYIANDPITAGRFWNGSIDEPRLSSIVRSADWITTEYNNQSAPETFMVLGSEV